MSRELYKDDRYFEDYIICQNKRIEKFADTLRKLEAGDASKVQQCQRYLANFYRDLMSAKYSIGASKQEVKRYFQKYLDAVEHCMVSNYAEMVDILSLVILFDFSAEKAGVVLENSDYDEDALVSVLKDIILKNDMDAESDHLLFPEEYDTFYKYIKGDIDTQSFLKFMEEDWYSLCKDFAWYDSHKSTESVYVGYWCWLAGASLKINAAIVSDNRYIPFELL